MASPIKILEDDLTPQKKLTKLPVVYKIMRRGSEMKRLDLTPIFDVILLGFFFPFPREISEMKSRHDFDEFFRRKNWRKRGLKPQRRDRPE